MAGQLDGWRDGMVSCTVCCTLCKIFLIDPVFEDFRMDGGLVGDDYHVYIAVVRVAGFLGEGELHGSSPLLADDIRVMRDIG